LRADGVILVAATPPLHWSSVHRPRQLKSCRAVTVRYSAFLNRGDPFQTDMVATYAVGARNTIAGLSWGVEGMRVGGRRRLREGPHLAYRDKGVPGVIPPNAKLVFEVVHGDHQQ
jgi:FKBP-type peptidyl-prolyl cis-trans isomerase